MHGSIVRCAAARSGPKRASICTGCASTKRTRLSAVSSCRAHSRGQRRLLVITGKGSRESGRWSHSRGAWCSASTGASLADHSTACSTGAGDRDRPPEPRRRRRALRLSPAERDRLTLPVVEQSLDAGSREAAKNDRVAERSRQGVVPHKRHERAASARAGKPGRRDTSPDGAPAKNRVHRARPSAWLRTDECSRKQATA